MGISSKKSSSQTKTNQNTSMTTTPINPSWVTGGLESLGGRITDTFKNLDPRSLVAGPDPLQSLAGTAATNLGISPLLDDAAGIFKDVAGRGANTYDPTTGKASLVGETPNVRAASVLDNLNAYMSPYTDRVVDTSLAGFDRDRALTRAQQSLDLAGDTTFGGSGGSILRALTEGELGLSRGQLEAGLRDEGFRFGAGLSEGDANRRQSASTVNAQNALQRALANQAAENQFGLANMGAANDAGRFNAGAQDTALTRMLSAGGSLADLGLARGAEERANVGTQADIGSMLRAIEQQQAMAGPAALGLEAGIWNSLPLDLLRGSTSNGTMTGTSTGTGKESGASLGDWLNFFAANASASKGG